MSEQTHGKFDTFYSSRVCFMSEQAHGKIELSFKNKGSLFRISFCELVNKRLCVNW